MLPAQLAIAVAHLTLLVSGGLLLSIVHISTTNLFFPRPAGLLTGDAINCARILEFIQCRYHENRAEASGLAADEDDKFFSNSARKALIQLAHDLCLAFASIEATHRVEFSITDKATPATLEIYDQRLKDQRTLLAQQFPAPVPNVRRCVCSTSSQYSLSFFMTN